MAANKTSVIKRPRRTKGDIDAIREAIYEYAKAYQPVTCRQVFYGVVVQGLIAKTQNEYGNTICRLMADMRESGELPWDWVADNTRWMRKPETYTSLYQMLRRTYETYRRSLWDELDDYVEIWCESDAVAGCITEVSETWDVPLMVSRGFASKTFLHSAAETIANECKPTYLYYLGDYDPSGVHIDRKIESELRRYAPEAEIYFERIAVTLEQIHDWDLPGSPPKSGDRRSKTFDHTEAVEIESITPTTLRDLVSQRVEGHIDPDVLERLRVVERAEKSTLITAALSMINGTDYECDEKK